MSRFWSPLVSTLVPYTPGEQPRDRVFIKLNTNENPHGPSPKAVEAIHRATGDELRLYPDPLSGDLRASLAAGMGLSPDQVFVGNGSDEVLAHAFNAFFTGKAPVAFADITYSFYRTYCELYGIERRHVPLTEGFGVDVADYTGEQGGVVLANPNAPTGIALPLDAVEQVLKQNPDCVVLVDEAYVDFGAESAVSLIDRYENLLVVQTFSKSRSLAGMRVGFAMGQRPLIEGLERVKDSFNSYPLDRLAQVGAQAAWEDHGWFDATRYAVMAERERLTVRLRGLGFKVLPSATNFVFASHPGHAAAELQAALREAGILVRHFGAERIRDWLRISIGTAEECDALVAALDEILA